MERNKHMMKFITGLLLGGLAGAAAAMLFAPQSGDDTRQMIRNTALDAKVRAQDTLRQAQDQVSSKVEDVQQRVSSMTDDVRSKASRLKDVGSDMMKDQRSSFETGMSGAEDIVRS